MNYLRFESCFINMNSWADISGSLNYIGGSDFDGFNSVGTQENEVYKQSMCEQVNYLRHEVMDITEKLHSNNTLLDVKDTENRELKEKLAALEIAVENLYDTSNKVGCCSGSCQIY